MEDFTYYAPTRYIFGRGAEDRAGALSRQYLGTHVLIVYGQGSVVRSGLLARVKGYLEAAGVTYDELGGIVPNPLDEPVYRGIALCRERSVTGLLAVGGGSAIDTAKAIAAGVPYEGDFWDFYAGRATVDEALPVGVVLTIPAAGSEGSGNSVITKTDGMRKISLRTDWALRPKFALLDPVLTMTLPPFQTACGVADMMAHILERYFTPSTDCETTDRVAEGVLQAIINEAPKVLAHPDAYQPRANIMWAGTLAHNGVCGTGRREDWTSHFLEHELSALYGVTHGAGLAVVFPAWLTFMAEHNPVRVAQLAHRVWGVDIALPQKEAALEGVARMKRFFHSLGLPVTLHELGVDNPDYDTLVRKLHENKGEVIGAYFPLDAAMTRRIYQLMVG